MKILANATMPKSSGVNKRARIRKIRKDSACEPQLILNSRPQQSF
jgi:hypothetical protein